MERDVAEFEPRLALDGGLDGLSEIRKVIKKSSELIKKKGKFILEIGFDQKNKVINLLKKEGFYIDDFVDVNDSIALSGFLKEYRKKFRGYVEEAIELARNIETLPPKRKKELITNIGFVSPVEKEFEADVRELEIKNVKNTNFAKNWQKMFCF